MKYWIDVTSPPHVHFFRALIKRLEKQGDEVLVTSRSFGIMNGILENNGIKYTSIGSHGGKNLEDKLIHSSERVIGLARLISKEKPDIALSKHSIESARVAFGMGIPSVSVIDHETASKQSRLTAPLANIVVSPEATEKAKLEAYGARAVKTFYGVCETAHFSDFKPSDGVLNELGLGRDEKIIIARSEPMLSSHNFHRSALLAAVRDMKKEFPEAKVVFIPRSDGDRKLFAGEGLIMPENPIDTLSLYSFASLMVGAGSCMNREACISGCPTISLCPDRLPGVDRFLVEKGLMFHSTEKSEIMEKASEFLESDAQRRKNNSIIGEFEDPHKTVLEAALSLVE